MLYNDRRIRYQRPEIIGAETGIALEMVKECLCICIIVRI